MAYITPLYRLLAPSLRVSSTVSRPLTRTLPIRPLTKPQSKSTPSIRPFSQTSQVQYPPQRGGKASLRQRQDPRIRLIRYHLQHPLTPRPLRFSRNRALRHWTIHRAWMLWRRKVHKRQEDELLRLYQSTHAACEELRTMDSPSMKDAGRLYRLAMEKKEIYGHEGVPIEYARAQTDTPARVGWNHEWTRS